MNNFFFKTLIYLCEYCLRMSSYLCEYCPIYILFNLKFLLFCGLKELKFLIFFSAVKVALVAARSSSRWQYHHYAAASWSLFEFVLL